MLRTAALVLQAGVEVALLAGMLNAAHYRVGGRVERRPSRPLTVGGTAAALGGTAVALGARWLGGREVVEGVLVLGEALSALAFLAWLVTEKPNSVIGAVTAFFLLVVPLAGAIRVLPVVFAGNTGLLTTEMLSTIAGVLLGATVAVLLGLTLSGVYPRLSRRGVLAVSGMMLLATAVRGLVAFVQMLYAVGVLDLPPWGLEALIWFINRDRWFFYSLPGAAVLLLVLAILAAPGKDPVTVDNPARRRKIRAAILRDKRRVHLFGAALGAALVLLAANQVYSSRRVQLSPAVAVSARGAEVRVPLDSVSDGNLHRFAYLTGDGVEVRFIVILKGKDLYGVGLDACAICGPTGYYQRGKQVVCVNCDVIINLPTIGFPGGCNPVPLDHRVQGGDLVIPVRALEAEVRRFR